MRLICSNLHFLHYDSRFFCYFNKSIQETHLKCHLHHPNIANNGAQATLKASDEVSDYFLFLFIYLSLRYPTSCYVQIQRRRYLTDTLARKLSHQLLPPTGGKNWKKNFILETRKESEPDAKFRNFSFLSSFHFTRAISRKRNSKFLGERNQNFCYFSHLWHRCKFFCIFFPSISRFWLKGEIMIWFPFVTTFATRIMIKKYTVRGMRIEFRKQNFLVRGDDFMMHQSKKNFSIFVTLNFFYS